MSARASLPTALACSGHIVVDDEGGGPEKLGYLKWHDRAKRSYARGERQRQCVECKRWFFPWELDSR